MRQVHCSRNVAIAILLAGLAAGACKHPTPTANTTRVSTPPVVNTPDPTPAPCTPPSVTLTVSTNTLTQGQSATLQWQAFNADSLRIEPEIGAVPLNGNRQVSPQSSVTYNATASSKCGNQGGVARITVAERVAGPPAPVDRPLPPAIEVPPTQQQTARGGGVPPQPPAPTRTVERLQNILFDYDQSDLRPDQMPQLLADVNWLKQNPNVRVIVEGHADERGNQEYNIALGVRRANTIVAYLVSQGVTEARLTTTSYGKERPECRDANPDEGCHQKNRRAAFSETR